MSCCSQKRRIRNPAAGYHARVTYTFRNRFRLRQLDADVQEIVFADTPDDGLVRLWPVRREPPRGRFLFAFEVTKRGDLISQADELVLQGDGYRDLGDAVVAGRKWRQNLTIALAHEFRGVDFGSDEEEHIVPSTDRVLENEPPDIFQQIGLKIGDRVIFDDPGLLVFETEPTPIFVNSVMGNMTLKLERRHERIAQRAKDSHKRDRLWGKQKTLAYRLVHTALIDSNPETRHILLVTAVEAMLEHQDRPRPELDELDEFLKQVRAWTDDKRPKKRVVEILREARKEESINRAGAEQISRLLDGTYFDKAAGEFFKYVYNLRSGLVHRERPGRPRPQIDEIQRVFTALVQFVLDVLDAKRTA